jgi:hypothetical protein
MHRRFIAWVGGTVGGLAAYRLLRRRPAEPTEPAPSEALDERRRRVHEEGRATIDEMRRE